MRTPVEPSRARPDGSARPRVVFLASPATYRTEAFLRAASRLDLDVVRAIDTPAELHVEAACGAFLPLDFADPDAAAVTLARLSAERPIAALVPLDDSATLLAAHVGAALGMPHNDPDAALAARDKWVMREALRRGGVPTPAYRRFPLSTDPMEIVGEILFPVVVKPTTLSGSRGVIRADDAIELAAAWERARRIVLRESGSPDEGELLVERYLPGIEVALEGLLTGGQLQTLALFDKPDPLEGPFFEETIYVTPSRLPEATRAAISARTGEAAAALGLREGPVHAELRLNDEGVWLIEMAGRSIGGLCSTILEFGAGVSLEELILRHAVERTLPATERIGEAAGVMMIPIPKGGILRGVSGIEAARAVPGVTGVEITAPLNQPVTPLPEGASYLGFIFARASAPEDAEAALRAAHDRLAFRIDPAISLSAV
ncbi:MAG: ATP-grasp domain-containing protein [Thermomicrobiales bacterium]|nr:ATP-grasp domain-containing protein [Thermomicrobiales bacterium]